MSIKNLLVWTTVLFSACIPALAFGQDSSGQFPSETVRQPPVVVAPKPQTQTVSTPSTTNDDDPWHVKTVYHPDIQSSKENSKLAFGMQLDVGAPSGGTAALVVSPFLPWLKLDIGGGFNGLNGGIIGGVALDPIRFPIAPTLSCDVGAFMPGKLPGVSKSPDIGYTFEDAMLGLEVGKQTGFRFFFRGGVAHLDVNADHLDRAFTLPNGATMTSANASVLMPAAKLGFTLMF